MPPFTPLIYWNPLSGIRKIDLGRAAALLFANALSALVDLFPTVALHDANKRNTQLKGPIFSHPHSTLTHLLLFFR